MDKIKQKLHVYNSYLEIGNEEIINLNLEYGITYYDVIHYKNGKKDKAEVQECIVFEKEEVGDFSVLTISNKSYMLFIE